MMPFWYCINCQKEWRDKEVEEYIVEKPLPGEHDQEEKASGACPDCGRAMEMI